MYRLSLFVASLVVFGAVMRMLPHAANVTPIAAISFVAGIYLSPRIAVAIPVITLGISDMFIGFYDLRLMAVVYLAFAIIGLLAMAARSWRSVAARGMLLVTGSTLFFLTTNGAVWFFSPWYEKSFEGLLYAYELGLPFFRNMLVGDIVYTALLVGGIEAVRYFFARRRWATFQRVAVDTLQ